MTPDTDAASPPPTIPDKATRIAELKAAHPQGRVVSFKGDDRVLVLRRPTEAEGLAIMDKSRLASEVKPSDNAYNYDNGTGEILRLVEVPGRAEVAELAAERPMIARTLWREVMAHCKVRIEAPPAEGTSLVFKVDGKVDVKVARINRATYERLDFQRLKSEHKMLLPSWLADVAKKNLLQPTGDEADRLWDRYPFLSNFLGTILFGETTLEVESEEGESSAAT